jgi:hypothetical protein
MTPNHGVSNLAKIQEENMVAFAARIFRTVPIALALHYQRQVELSA